MMDSNTKIRYFIIAGKVVLFYFFIPLPDVHSTIQRFLTVQAAVTPTSVLPAPDERRRQ